MFKFWILDLKVCLKKLGSGLYQKSVLYLEASVLIDGKRYNVAKVRSRLKWTPKFTHFSSFMAEDYVIEGKVSVFSYPNH